MLGEEGLIKQLKKALLERALGAELSDHLGYEKGDPAGRGAGNSRNGHSAKTASTTASCRSMRALSKAWPREIRNLERQLMVWHRADETSRRLETIPGVGIITATALAASIPDPAVFKTGRQFAAFLGLVPRQNSSGGKDRFGRISKMGDRYLRRLLVLGATSVVRRVGSNTSATGAWVRGLLERKPSRVVTVAIANKTARIAWGVLARGETYRAPKAA